MIDWELIAKQNGLTPEEFQNEIFTVAAVVGAMAIDNDGADMIKFTTSDQVSKLVLTVQRIN